MASSSSRQSISSAGSYTSTYSLLIHDVPTDLPEEKLYEEIRQNYPSVLQAECLPVSQNARVGKIRLDFSTAAAKKRILNINYMLINGKRYPITSYSSKAPTHALNKRYDSPVSPASRLNKTQLELILDRHTKHVESLIESFEERWNQRMQQFQRTPIDGVNKDQLMALVGQLSRFSHAFADQLNQFQRTMASKSLAHNS